MLAGAGAAALGGPAAARPRETLWTLDRLERIGGHAPQVLGAPKLSDSPWGPAAAFDGEDDALLVPEHPLAGAGAFTIEALIRPDGGRIEQRWLHLAQDAEDPGVSGGTRILFEIRVAGAGWYLDAFIKGPGYALTLVAPEKLHPLGEWRRVTQVCDGRRYAAFVDGVLQAQGQVDFKPQGPGRTSIGVRMNRVDWFRGAIRELRFMPQAVWPGRVDGHQGGPSGVGAGSP